MRRNPQRIRAAIAAAITCAATVLCAAAKLIMYPTLDVPTTNSTLAPSTAPATAPAVMSDADWKSLEQQLLAKENAARVAALPAVQQVPPTRLNSLRALLLASEDPIVRSAVHSRLLEIKHILALHPLPLSLDLHQASRATARQALLELTGQNPDSVPHPDNDNTSDRYTYTGHDQSYWDIFSAFARQGDLFKDEDQPLLGPHNSQHAGPFVISIGPIMQASNVSLGSGGAALVSLSASILVDAAVDPRVRLVGFIGPTITDITDENGASLLPPSNEQVFFGGGGFGGGFRRGYVFSSQQHWTSTSELVLPAPPRNIKKIASLKGSATFQVATEDEIEIPDVQNHLNTPVKCGETSQLTVNTFTVVKDQFQVSFVVGGNQDSLRGGLFTLLDARGRSVFQQQLNNGGNSISRSVPNTTGPYKLRVEWPVSVEEVEVPFEFKDLPLP